MESPGFLELIVLLSSAVADADNQVMTSGKKLELLAAIDQMLPSVAKSEIQAAQKKLEDLCLRMLFQSCPAVITRLIIKVLSTTFSRGSNASMHAFVAFLLQLSMYSPKDNAQLDRPIPGQDDEEGKPISVQEKAACFTVAVGIVVARGPSASYFVPNIIACMHKHVKVPDPAARESALRALRAVISVIGIPGTSVGADVFKHFLYKSVYGEKSPQVRIVAAHALAIFCAKCPIVALGNADTIQGVALKVLLSSASDALRHSHACILQQLLLTAIQTKRDKEESLSASSVKNVTSFPSAVAFLTILMKKYKQSVFAVEALTAVAVRLALALGEREDDLLFLGKSVVSEVAPISVSVASRALNRVLRAGDGDSGTLRIVSEIVMPAIRAPPLAEQSLYVCLSGLVEAMSIVEGSISALDSNLASDLVQLITATASTAVAVNAAYALRALCRVTPAQSFALANVLLNHITVQIAELAGSGSTVVGPVFNFSLALASVLCECVSDLPQDVVSAVVSTAQSLIGSEESGSATTGEWTKKSTGFVLLTPVIGLAALTVLSDKAVALFGLWKCVLGKKAKDAFASAVSPGTVIQDVSPLVEYLQTVLVAVRSLKMFLARSSEWLRAHPDGDKMALMLLNNVWQITQLAVPLEQSVAAVTVVVHAIRAELFEALLTVHPSEAMGKPLAAYLSSELLKPPLFPISPPVLFDACVDAKSILAPSLLETADSVLEEQNEWETLLSVSVEAALRALGGPALAARDYFASAICCGSLEEYYALFPTSSGSSMCPQIPFLPSINSLQPMAGQMTHPVFESRRIGIALLSSLLAVQDSAESCIVALSNAYKSVEQKYSLEYEESSTSVTGCSDSLTVAVVCACFTKMGAAGKGMWLPTVAAGLGAVHPFTRRASAVAMAALYANEDSSRDLIFQCVTDSAVSRSARTRSAAALLIAFMIDFSPQAINQLAPSLFKLSRELTAPTRICALFSLLTAASAAGNSMAPWSREVLKVVTAHLVADMYPNGLAGSLMAAIVAAIHTVAAMSASEAQKAIVLWAQLSVSDEDVCSTFSVLTKRFSVHLASQAGNDKKIAGYVIDRIGESIESSSALCRDALVALTEIVELSESVPIKFDFYDALFSVSDLNPALRTQVDRLLKCMLREQGAEALPFILASLGSGPAGAGTDEHRDEDDYDSDSEEKRRTPVASPAAPRNQVTQKTKALMLKCVKRIFKSSNSNRNLFRQNLDQLINVAVSAVAGETAPALALQGAKLLSQLVDAFGPEMVVRKHADDDSPVSDDSIPILLAYETQIVSALRKGVRSNSDSAPAVQRVCLEIVERELEMNLSSSSEKLVDLLVQPLVLVDPATMPWSSFFSLRETGNTILSGRSGLGQSNEREVSRVLFTRITVIVNLLDRNVATIEFRKHASFIHYFLLRILIDCASAGGPHVFAFLESDRQALMETIHKSVVPTVLNGLSIFKQLKWGDLTCPSDCPFKRDVDMHALFAGVTLSAVERVSTAKELDGLARAIQIVAFEMGYSDLAKVFDLELPPRFGGDLSQLLQFAHRVVADEIKTVPAGTVWQLALRGMNADPDLQQLTEIVKWLFARRFFSESHRAVELVHDCLYPSVQKQPQALVRLLRESISDVIDMETSVALTEALTELMERENVNLQFCLVLVIPVFAKLVGDVKGNGVVGTLVRLKQALLKHHSETHVVIQGISKLLSQSPVSKVFVTSFFLPIVVELIARSADDAISLLSPLITVTEKESVEWKHLVQFVIELVAMEQINEESIAKALLLCMQPVDIFKAALAAVSSESKARVEMLVRKYMPKREAKSDEEQPTAQVASAPQIQLKLKFGKD